MSAASTAQEISPAANDAAGELATFFEVSLDLLCIRDMDLKFNRVNRTWERVLGYAMSELEGMEMLPLVHPDDREATLGHMRRMEREDEVHGFINRYRHKDGHYRSLEWRAKRIGGKVFGAARDVTDRLAMQADLEVAKRAAEAANQAKSDFLANVSHEIRTPLNGVVGVLGVLRQTPLSEAQSEMLDLVESSAATLERLVSDLLDVSKIEAGSLSLEARPFRLRDLEGVIEVFRLRAEDKGLTFAATWDLADAAAAVVGDVTRIKQVLGNLLSNAVKFTLRGGVCVRIATAPTTADGGAALDIEVTDTGVGFEPAFAENLFGRFSQADSTITRRFGGTGLGLAICRSLVEVMGGRITARSTPGSGSAFWVSLPLRAAAVPPAASLGSVEDHMARLEHGRAGPLRILLAEDHPVNRRVVELILGAPHFEVVAVENGAEAVEAFAAGQFDLVLLDMQMPVMDGLTAARAIRLHETSRRTPIAMLTANAQPAHVQAAVEAGADLHIAKPVTAAALLAGIVEALGPQAA